MLAVVRTVNQASWSRLEHGRKEVLAVKKFKTLRIVQIKLFEGELN